MVELGLFLKKNYFSKFLKFFHLLFLKKNIFSPFRLNIELPFTNHRNLKLNQNLFQIHKFYYLFQKKESVSYNFKSQLKVLK